MNGLVVVYNGGDFLRIISQNEEWNYLHTLEALAAPIEVVMLFHTSHPNYVWGRGGGGKAVSRNARYIQKGRLQFFSAVDGSFGGETNVTERVIIPFFSEANDSALREKRRFCEGLYLESTKWVTVKHLSNVQKRT